MISTKELFKKSLPIILSQSSSVVMGLVNLIFIGSFGYREIGIVGISNVFIQNALILLTSYTFQTSLNVVKVKNDRFETEKEILNSLMIIALINIPIVIILAIFSNQLLMILGASSKLIKIGLIYFLIRLFSTLFIATSRVFIALFRGLGKNSLTMYIAIFSNIVNVLLNFLSVEVFHFGLNSLAFSLLISETVQIVILIFCVKREGYNIFSNFKKKFNIQKIKKVNFEGYKIGLQDIGLALTSIVFNMFAAKIGTKELAATEVLLNLLTITYLPGIGIGIIASIEVGEIINNTKKNISNQLKRLRITFLKVALLFNLPVSLAFIFFSKPIAAIFTSNSTIIDILIKIMLLSAIFLFFDTAQMILTDCIRAFEKNNELLIITLTLSILLFIPLSYFTSFILKFGIYGMWISFYFYLIVQAIILNYLYSKEAKRRING
ncbi:MAG: MATE family efflux transporter [Bombilactobacillus mellifer]|nr:MATE family efflux transporter [Bombilactobacillus mellifer]